MANDASRITISLSNKDYLELAAMAKTSDVSLSWLARAAISEFLKQHKQDHSQLPLSLLWKRK